MERELSGPEASEAVHDDGWRLVLGALCTFVPVKSLRQAVGLAADAVEACGDADRHLHVDIRPERVVFTVQSPDLAAVTAVDVELAHRISAALRAAGSTTQPEVGTGAPRCVQLLEIAIDALDIPSIRPFWKAVLGYADAPGA